MLCKYLNNKENKISNSFDINNLSKYTNNEN